MAKFPPFLLELAKYSLSNLDFSSHHCNKAFDFIPTHEPLPFNDNIMSPQCIHPHMEALYWSNLAQSPTVYFSFAISTDTPPNEIMAWVNVDWNILGGTRLAIKTLGVFNAVTLIVLYFLWNDDHSPSILKDSKSWVESLQYYWVGNKQKSHQWLCKSRSLAFQVRWQQTFRICPFTHNY